MNYSRGLPVGSIVHSMLTEAQFQAETREDWILADGGSVSGSRYTAITGNSNVPDLRGIYLRGKNNGRSDGNEDPTGDQALGTFEADQNQVHSHGVTDPTHAHSIIREGGSSGSQETFDISTKTPGNPHSYSSTNAQSNSWLGFSSTGITIDNQGSNDARPNSVVVNIFIKIN